MCAVGVHFQLLTCGKTTFYSDDGSASCTNYGLYEISGNTIWADVSEWSNASDGLYFMGVFVDNGGEQSLVSLI